MSTSVMYMLGLISAFLISINLSTGLESGNSALLLHHGDKVKWIRPGYDPTKRYSDLPANASVLTVSEMPHNKKWYPEVGNGQLATVIYSDTIYMNGLYNGHKTASHRARIPSPAALTIASVNQKPQTKTYSLDLGQGVFENSISGDGFLVLQATYAHRTLTDLIVVEFLLRRADVSIPLNVNISHGMGPKSSDVNMQAGPSGIPNANYEFGTIVEEEYPTSGLTPVHMYYTKFQPVLQLTGESLQATWAFITSISTKQDEAKASFDRGVKEYMSGDLYSEHIKNWIDMYSTGRVDVVGDDSMAQVTYACLYYLYSSVPLTPPPPGAWPFFGMSPGGLAHGAHMKDYQGHVFWDQETWMFPPILTLHAEIGKSLVDSRIRVLDAAKENAKARMRKGAKFPWESAFTGQDVDPSNETATYEIHNTGDIALAFQQYLHMTNDTGFLVDDRGKEAILDIAEYWASRVQKIKTGMYGALDVCPPDEFHCFVNNSGYTNAIAQVSLRLPKYALGLIGETPPPMFEIIADNMFIPYDADADYHPEYDGYDGTEVKQADIILLQFPIGFVMSLDTRQNDIEIYEKVTSPTGPAMTWGMFSLGWLELKQFKKADTFFKKQFQHVKGPFKIWTESNTGTGATNFATGMGGFLQSLIFGYGGFRSFPGVLEFDPEMPAGVNTFNLTGVDFLGKSLNFVFTDTLMNITDVQNSMNNNLKTPVVLAVTLYTLGPNPFPLEPMKTLSFVRQKGSIVIYHPK